MNETLTNITIKLPAKDWQKMAELYGKNRAWEIRKAIKKLIENAQIRNLTQEENRN